MRAFTPTMLMSHKTCICLVSTVLMISGALAEPPASLPQGPLLAEALPDGMRCDQTITYPRIPSEQLVQAPLPVARSFIRSRNITEVTARLANGSESKGFLTKKLILESGQGIGVDSVANAEPATLEQFDCLALARWIAVENFTGLEAKGAAKLWRFAKAHPLLGQQVVLIDPETHLPVSYSDSGKSIAFSYSQDSSAIRLPPELQRARERFLSLYPDGVAPARK